MLFFTILANVILPIFVIIGVGFLMDRLFHLDMRTLSKLNFYVFIPALTFVKFLESDLSGESANRGQAPGLAMYTPAMSAPRNPASYMRLSTGRMLRMASASSSG